jgi:hypothetical protein
MTQSANLAAVGSYAVSTGLPFSGASVITSGTAVASTSGTSIDFTSIPSWVKRVTVLFNGVSTNGTSIPVVQIGAGSIITTGYSGAAGNTYNSTSASITAFTNGFGIAINTAAAARYGAMQITNVSGNIWVSTHNIADASQPVSSFGGGGLTLSGALDRVRITTTNGTDTFDAGTINILYE